MLIKIESPIEMKKHHDCKIADLSKYINKLVYLLCKTCPDIFFIVENFSRLNANSWLGYI